MWGIWRRAGVAGHRNRETTRLGKRSCSSWRQRATKLLMEPSERTISATVGAGDETNSGLARFAAGLCTAVGTDCAGYAVALTALVLRGTTYESPASVWRCFSTCSTQPQSTRLSRLPAQRSPVRPNKHLSTTPMPPSLHDQAISRFADCSVPVFRSQQFDESGGLHRLS
jgi:hypothetical protein